MTALTQTPTPSLSRLADLLRRIEVPIPALGGPHGWMVAIALGIPLVLGAVAGGAHAVLDLSRSRAAYMAISAEDDRMVGAVALLDGMASLDVSAKGRWGRYESPSEGTVITKGEVSLRIGDRALKASANPDARISTERTTAAYPLVTVSTDSYGCWNTVHLLRTGPNAHRIQVSRSEEALSSAGWVDVTDFSAASSACRARGPDGHASFRIRP